MSTRTLGALATRHGVDLLDHLDQELSIPVLAGLQFQGDVAIVPTDPALPVAVGDPVPAAGVPVVRGEAGGNTHLLVADGAGVTWLPAIGRPDLALGVLTVPDGATAYLLHPEHGANGIAPGAYEVRRQREQADEVRLVAD